MIYQASRHQVLIHPPQLYPYFLEVVSLFICPAQDPELFNLDQVFECSFISQQSFTLWSISTFLKFLLKLKTKDQSFDLLFVRTLELVDEQDLCLSQSLCHL